MLQRLVIIKIFNKMKKIIIGFICIYSFQLYSQIERNNTIEEYKCVLFWSGYTLTLYNGTINNKTLYSVNDTSFLKITFQDSSINNIVIEEFDIWEGKDTVKTVKSSYFTYKDTLSCYLPVLNADAVLVSYEKHKYFQLFPDGESLFWNKKNKLIKRIYWEKGVLKKTEELE